MPEHLVVIAFSLLMFAIVLAARLVQARIAPKWLERFVSGQQ
jgi:hypothetical protein